MLGRNLAQAAAGNAEAAEVDHSWQLEYASFTGTPNNSFHLTEEGGLTSVTFKSDGTKMYTTGFVQDLSLIHI